MKKETVQETNRRFKNFVKIDPSGCWVWTGGLCKGYPDFYLINKQRSVRAHRYLWELLNGKISEGLELHHRCENKACIRPSHLKLLSHADHMKLHARSGLWSGEKNSQSKRTSIEVLTIKFLNEFFALKAKHIARGMKIPKRSIFSIIARDSWKSVELPKDFGDEAR